MSLFFISAALWALIDVALWVGLLTGHVAIVPGYGALAWHAHELLFGYVGAVLAGFLSVALPNWTGRGNGGVIAGWSSWTLWLAGRLAMLAYPQLGVAALVIDSAFPALLAIEFARQLIVARNWVNLRVAFVVACIAVSNIWFHWEVTHEGGPAYALRASLALIVVLIMLIAGRLVPVLTTGWLMARRRPPYAPGFGAVDVCALGLSFLALVRWIAEPAGGRTAALLLIAGAAHAWRLARWRGWAVVAEPLIVVLHGAYAFIVLGFFAVGGAALAPRLTTATLHAWTAGAIGLASVGMMARLALARMDLPPIAPPGTGAALAALALAALLRLAAPFTSRGNDLLVVSAAAWCFGYAGFLLRFVRCLVARVPES